MSRADGGSKTSLRQCGGVSSERLIRPEGFLSGCCASALSLWFPALCFGNHKDAVCSSLMVDCFHRVSFRDLRSRRLEDCRTYSLGCSRL